MRLIMDRRCDKEYLTENRWLHDSKFILYIGGSSTSIFKISSEVEKSI